MSAVRNRYQAKATGLRRRVSHALESRNGPFRPASYTIKSRSRGHETVRQCGRALSTASARALVVARP